MVLRGVASDNWREDKFPRKISYRCNDFSLLLSLVREGLALAYVPDFVARSLGFTPIKVGDITDHAKEEINLIYKPSQASGWLNRFISALKG